MGDVRADSDADALRTEFGPVARDGTSATRDADEIAAWARSGAMALCGRAEGPALGPPTGLVSKLQSVAGVLRDRAAALGRDVTLDPLALLVERAALLRLSRRGTTSCGRATRLLPTLEGWIAVTLSRDEDRELVNAWLERDDVRPRDETAMWEAITASVGHTPGVGLIERGILLGLPVALLPSSRLDPILAHSRLAPLPLTALRIGDDASPRPRRPLVVDLSSLWAGPLCGSLLHLAGARVVKVESTSRPDGARDGDPRVFDLLNGGKECVALDLRVRAEQEVLAALIARADVVIEASRPRALEHLGIVATDAVQRGNPQVWVSITGHGRTGRRRSRVAFGDDAAVAGGLVVRDDHGPCFCADAIADPLTGIVAAAAALDALATGGRWLLDLSMANVAAYFAGPTLPVPAGVVAAAPQEQRVTTTARPLGADTEAVLAELRAD